MSWFNKTPKAKLPRDIRQLVDKGNFVIAIKELSSRDNISLDEAKARIDQYEAEQSGQPDSTNTDPHTANQPANANDLQEQGFSKLTDSVTRAIEDRGVSARIIPKWMLFLRRVLFIFIIAYLLSMLFR